MAELFTFDFFPRGGAVVELWLVVEQRKDGIGAFCRRSCYKPATWDDGNSTDTLLLGEATTAAAGVGGRRGGLHCQALIWCVSVFCWFVLFFLQMLFLYMCSF